MSIQPDLRTPASAPRHSAAEKAGEESGISTYRPTLRELEVLIAVVETGKTTAAAMRLQVSQPAISRALSSLEVNCTRTLFTRDSGRLIPTADGRAMAEEAQAIFLQLDKISGGRAYLPSSELRIVSPPTPAHRFLQGVIASFIATHKDIKVHLEIGTTYDVINAVAERQADLGVTDNPVTHGGIQIVPFRRAHAHLVVPLGHPLAEAKEVGPDDLARYPFVALTRRFPSRPKLERLLAQNGLSLDIKVETATSASVSELVAEGVGIGLINPFPVSLRQDPRVKFIPFAPQIQFETKFLMPLGVSSATAQSFIDHVRDNATSDAFSQAI